MARTVDTINQATINALVSNLSSIGITINPNNWSKRNILRMLCYTFASCCALAEQLMDLVQSNIEDTVSRAAAASQLWVQQKMFEFQYSSTVPQVIQMIDGIPQYPFVDESLRIITACSVKSDLANNVQIKVAKGNPLTALVTLELNAAQSFINTIGTAGIIYVVKSANPDLLFIDADIYYKGEYAPIIQLSVVAALDSYLLNLSVTNFDGGLKVSDLEVYIKSLPGVTDVLLKNVSIRATTVLFGSGTYLVQNETTLIREYIMVAGYAKQETTSGQTFSDTLNFIAQ